MKTLSKLLLKLWQDRPQLVNRTILNDLLADRRIDAETYIGAEDLRVWPWLHEQLAELWVHRPILTTYQRQCELGTAQVAKAYNLGRLSVTGSPVAVDGARNFRVITGGAA